MAPQGRHEKAERTQVFFVLRVTFSTHVERPIQSPPGHSGAATEWGFTICISDSVTGWVRGVAAPFTIPSVRDAVSLAGHPISARC